MRSFHRAAVAALGLTLVGCGDGRSGTPLPPDFAYARSVTSSAPTHARSIAAFADGSSVVVGSMEGTITFAAGLPGQVTLTSSDGVDGYLARYAPNGTIVWTRRLLGPGDAGPATAVAVMTDGDVVVSGYFGFFGGSLTLGEGQPGQVTLVSAGDDDGFIARYTGSGILEWARRIGGTSVDQALAVSALPGGAVAVTGLFAGTITLGASEPNETTLVAPAGLDCYVATYAANGALLWATATESTAYAIGWGVGCGTDGTVSVAGVYSGTTTFGVGEPNEATHVSVGGSDDVFVARFAANGTVVWVRSAGGTGWEELSGVAQATDGSVRLTGSFSGLSTFGAEGLTPTTLDAPPSAARNAFLASYAADGTFAWAKQSASADVGNSSIGYSVAVGSDGAAVVVGKFLLDVSFELVPLTNGGAYDAFIARYLADGSLDWALSVSTGGDDAANGVSIVPDLTILVCGAYSGVVTFGPGEPNETTLPGSTNQDAFVARYNSNGGF